MQQLRVAVHTALQPLLAESAEVLSVFLGREWTIEVGPHQCRWRYADSVAPGQVRRVVGIPGRAQRQGRALGLDYHVLEA